MKLSIKEIVLTGVFTALTSVMAQVSIKIPFSPIPITLQVLSVCLAAVILGKKCGTLSQVAYILLGVCGFPVFSGFNFGLNAILGPTGGYIISFPFMAYVIAYTIEKIEKQKNITRFSIGLAMTAGLIVLYSFGTIWLAFSLKLAFMKALAMGVGWYLPLDILKVIISSSIGYEIRAALLRSKLIV